MNLLINLLQDSFRNVLHRFSAVVVCFPAHTIGPHEFPNRLMRCFKSGSLLKVCQKLLERRERINHLRLAPMFPTVRSQVDQIRFDIRSIYLLKVNGVGPAQEEKVKEDLKMADLVPTMIDGVFHEHELDMPLHDRKKGRGNVREIQKENASAGGIAGSRNTADIPDVFGKLRGPRIREGKRSNVSMRWWHYLSSCKGALRRSRSCVRSHASRNSSSLGCT